MKTTIKTLVNQVKKALTVKSSLPENISNAAFVNNNGDIIAHDFNTRTGAPDYDIMVFVAGIVEDVAARNMLYNKDALTLAGDTGIFKGGADLPEAYHNYYELPGGDFSEVVTIPAEDIKAAAACVSADNARPVLNNIHLDTRGYIESVDGFRAYRKNTKTMLIDGLTDFEKENGLLIPGRAAAYGFKGDVKIYNADRYIKLVDNSGLTLFVHKPTSNRFINLDVLLVENRKRNNVGGVVTVKDIKAFTSALKAAKNERAGVALRITKNAIEYYIPGLEIFGAVAADVEISTPADYYITINPRYIMDAINQDCYKFNFDLSNNAPIFVDGMDGARALLLPIRDDGRNPFEKYDAEKRAAAIEALNEKQNNENRFTNIGEKEIEKEIENQATENKPETVTVADDPEKLEIVKRENAPEILPPEVIKARAIYKELKAVNFTPSKFQESDADIIYQANMDKLKPIARRAGGLYIDTLAIIAAIMAIHEKLTEV